MLRNKYNITKIYFVISVLNLTFIIINFDIVLLQLYEKNFILKRLMYTHFMAYIRIIRVEIEIDTLHFFTRQNFLISAIEKLKIFKYNVQKYSQVIHLYL